MGTAKFQNLCRNSSLGRLCHFDPDSFESTPRTRYRDKASRRAAKSGAPALGDLKSATAERFTVVATNSRDAQPRQAWFTAWETGATRSQGEFRNQVAPRRSRT